MDIKTGTLLILVVLTACPGIATPHTHIYPGELPESTAAATPAGAPSDSVQIDRIFVIGNKKTRESIILRELDFKEGDWLDTAALEPLFEQNRNKIINTRLFLTVDLSTVRLGEDKIDVIIRVEERWYFFPIPIFELADRNFTEWWVNQNRDLSRVEYGLKLKQYNFRGRNETVSLTAQLGFTKLFRAYYQIPYINKNQKVGLIFLADYATNKNIAVRTVDHRLDFLDSDSNLRERFRASASATYRPSFYAYHQLGTFYSNVWLGDTVPQINSNYFPDSTSNLRYLGLSYLFVRDKRDYVGYPLTGSYLEAELEQAGLGIFDDVGITTMRARYSKYYQISKRLFFGSSIQASSSLPVSQPYMLYNGIGFRRRFIRGYEKYVIEGPHWMVNSNSFRINFFNKELSFNRLIPIRQFSTLPLAVYLSFNLDQGYIANYPNYALNTRFSNRYLVGGGLGVDIVTFYDFVMRWEYSFNIEGTSAFFLNMGAPF